MTIRAKIFPTLLALGLSAPALSQDNLLEYVVESCAADLEKYCSQVTPGQGRLLHCVAAHEDKLSGRCDYALYQAASLLEQLTAAIAYVARSCEPEIRSLCSDVEAGEGRLLSCLAEHDAEVGANCKQAIADTLGE